MTIPPFIHDKNLYSVYQPLMDTSNYSTFGFEALMRSPHNESPLSIIKEARKLGYLFELDTVSFINAVKVFPKSYMNSYHLFINIFPSTIIHPKFESFIHSLLEKYSHVQPKQIVIEISEDIEEQPLWDLNEFIHQVHFLKSLGFEIALDDLTITKGIYEKAKKIKPSYVKLDYTHSQNLSRSKEKQELITFFLEIMKDHRKLVLEGIDTKEDLITAKNLGVPLLQGFYISKPERLIGF